MPLDDSDKFQKHWYHFVIVPVHAGLASLNSGLSGLAFQMALQQARPQARIHLRRHQSRGDEAARLNKSRRVYLTAAHC